KALGTFCLPDELALLGGWAKKRREEMQRKHEEEVPALQANANYFFRLDGSVARSSSSKSSTGDHSSAVDGTLGEATEDNEDEESERPEESDIEESCLCSKNAEAEGECPGRSRSLATYFKASRLQFDAVTRTATCKA
ncbi:hypothetical protein FOZ63_022179, partial [Perkinsus olseni]